MGYITVGRIKEGNDTNFRSLIGRKVGKKGKNIIKNEVLFPITFKIIEETDSLFHFLPMLKKLIFFCQPKFC